jgi:alpha-L-fucosidase
MYKILLYVLFLCFFSCGSRTVIPPAILHPAPDEAQLVWQEKELLAFVHFTMNTFTDLEWGYGDEKPEIFHPTDFDPEQWAKVLKDAGFKGAILTCKHHDGFCLWPSAYTAHSVKSSKWENGCGDIVGDFKKACDKYGLEFGIYLSPWDRNRADYASPAYITYYRNQLKELLDKYGPIFEIWFDGANGGDGYYGGAREKRKIDDQIYYEWPETYQIAKSYNPNIIIRGDARSSADSRWCGNEKGYIGETNWNMVSPDTLLVLGNDRISILNTGSEYGSAWMPAEVDVSIRPGWFYHESENTLVKTPDELFDIYLSSVGRGSNLLLNVAPDKRGMIPEQDIQTLMEWKKKIDNSFADNIAVKAKVKAGSYRGKSERYAPCKVIDGNKETYWATDDGVHTGYIELKFDQPEKIEYIVIQEPILLGQRIKSFSIEAFIDNKWQQAAEGTTIGYKRIIPISQVQAEKIRLNIHGSRACPAVSNIEIY